MSCTTIDCPSCHRRISLMLRTEHSLNFKMSIPNIPDYMKEHNLQDILFVHKELIEENKRLHERILELNSRFSRSSYGDY